MSDKSFDQAMNQIAAQAEAAQLREQEAQRRQRLFAKVRVAFMFLLWTAALGCGFYYRAELQQFASDKFFSKPKVGQVDGNTSEALKGIQSQADKRDQMLKEISK